MGEYSKCKIDPSADGFVGRFKRLHPDFEEDLDLKKVSLLSLYTYIVLTYDIHSPFVQKHKDWALRRNETAKASKFKSERGKYIPEAENIIAGRNSEINRLVIRYLFMQNDFEFAKLHGYHILFFNAMISATNSLTLKPNESKVLKDNIDSLSSEIKLLQKSIFSGNETKDMLMSLYDFAANLTYDFRPEDIAEKKEKGEKVVDDTPYPKSYSTGEMHFIDDN